MAEEQAPPPMGDNAPDKQPTILPLLEQLPTPDGLVAELEQTHAAALARVEELETKGAKFFTITNDDEDARATEFLVALRTRYKVSEADRVATKTPFDVLAGAAQAFFMTRILGKLGGAPSNKTEEFDPVTSDQYGVGPRIGMAQTIYKRRKAETERRAREAEAARLREVERLATEKRQAAEREQRRIEDERLAAQREAQRQEQVRLDAERAAQDAERRRLEDEAAAAQLAAARKRSEASRAAGEAEALAARQRAEAQAREAAAAQAERDRQARERAEAQRQEDARLAAQRDERDRLAREEENRLAAERSAAEEAAGATTADLSRSRGGKGGVASLREFVDFRDLKRDQLGIMPMSAGGQVILGPPPILLLLPFIKDAALESAIKDFAKSNKHLVETGIKNGKQPIHGVTFFMNSKSAGRS